MAEFIQESRPIVFLLRVQCRSKESSRSLSHLLMSFLLNDVTREEKFLQLYLCVHCRPIVFQNEVSFWRTKDL